MAAPKTYLQHMRWWHHCKQKRFRCSGVFRSFKLPKFLQDSTSHRIFGRMHGALNVGKKITNCIVCL
jgi:hypothetical protein